MNLKKILILSSSLRNNSNSEMLAQKFYEGAKIAGNEVEFLSLKDKKIAFCKGCLACQKNFRCVIHDDADLIAQKMLTAEILVFATPIYYYRMSGQLKTMLDRANPLFPTDYKFREIYLLASAAENDEKAFTGALNGIENWLECFPKAKFAGKIFAGGVTKAGEIKNHLALEKAFEVGKNIL